LPALASWLTVVVTTKALSAWPDPSLSEPQRDRLLAVFLLLVQEDLNVDDPIELAKQASSDLQSLIWTRIDNEKFRVASRKYIDVYLVE
jgi:hypothetical protein